jgi:hypothetical protein
MRRSSNPTPVDDEEAGGKGAGQRKGRKKGHFDDDGGDDIMIIPDLDDEGDSEEDITVQVASAPKNVTRRVASLHELDSSLKHSVRSGSHGVDLSLLSNRLVPPTSVAEPDELWTFEELLQRVTQEFHEERERTGEDLLAAGSKEGEEKTEGAVGARDRTGRKVVLGGADAGAKKDISSEEAKQLDELIGAGKGLEKKKGGRRRRGEDA